MIVDDVIFNKVASIERCLKRIRDEYEGKEPMFHSNITIQDSIVLNLQRACESAIDLANYVVKKRKLGVPQNSRDGFDLLNQAGVISSNLSERLKKMTGFRNMAVHEYSALNLGIVEAIIKENLNDFLEFTSNVIKSDP